MRTVARLTSLWEEPAGVLGWLSTVDHKKLGKRYLVTAFLFLVVGGVEALLMRLQLASAGERLLTPEQYAQIFTMHGVTMIFWYASPVLSGFGIYFIPLLIGARDLAYPRLNAMTYWTFLFSGIFLYISPLVGESPAAGWFAYVPLTEEKYSPGLGMDFYALALVFLTISTTGGAANLIVTILRLRAPGMTIARAPLFLYSTFTAQVSVVFALPALTAACVFLELDRRFHFHFFDVEHGGNAILWQHLFWFFGHPWVYVIFLPATGMVSMLLPVFARRPIVGYPFVALATVVTGIVGFGVWVHHMFAIGMSQMSMSFFSAASMTISIQSTIQVLAWIATLWRGKPVLTTSLWFAIGFIVSLVLGGLSGVITAVVPFDWQVHDSYFVVAHLHYVLVGANVFPVFAGFYYWLPKITGRMNSELWGKASFVLMFVGFHLAFFPMHIAGLLGMPRRVFTYGRDQGWDSINTVITAGAFILVLGGIVSVVNWLVSMKIGRLAGKNPWRADTLEWQSPSPPPVYGHVHAPIVVSRHPLWDEFDEEHDPHEQRVLDERRLTFVTTPIDARVHSIATMPKETLTPLLFSLALAGVFVFLLVKAVVLAILAAAVSALLLATWLWPQHQKLPEPPFTDEELAHRGPPLTTILDDKRGTWGMWIAIATEAALFACMLFAYEYLGPWPNEEPPKLLLALILLAILVTSSLVLHFVGERAHKRGDVVTARISLAITVALGVVFLIVQGFEYANHLKKVTPQMGSYGSIFYTVTSLHALHVIVGVALLVYALVYPKLPRRVLKNTSLYWHFVDVVWVFIVALLYVIPNVRGMP